MTRTLVAVVLIVLLAPAQALAEDADLQRTISDLSSQTSDKEKMDALGATKVELSQIRGWLNDATNAVKEEAEKKCRRLFELVRAQLKLVDELITLSKIDDEARRLEQAIAGAQKKHQAAKNQLDDKVAKLRALKMKEKE